MGGGTVRKIHLIHLSTNQATAMTATFSTPKMRFSTPESWHMMIHSDDSIVIGFNRIQSNVSPCGSLVKENLEVAEMPWVFLNFLLECFFLFAVDRHGCVYNSHCCGSKSGKMGLNGSHRFQRRFLIQKNLVWSEISLPLGEKLVVFAWW